MILGIDNTFLDSFFIGIAIAVSAVLGIAYKNGWRL